MLNCLEVDSYIFRHVIFVFVSVLVIATEAGLPRPSDQIPQLHLNHRQQIH